MVAELVHGWPQVFALSTAFASMLLSLCKMDVALFHFYGGQRPEKQFFFSFPCQFTAMVENPAVRQM
jgi:hypothetical protein